MLKINRSWFLILFFCLLYLLPLGERPLSIPDETRYAEISREMREADNWVTPHLLGLRYFEKPVAGYWLNTISQMLFGENNFAVRFASALSTGLSALLLYWFALRLWGCPRKAQAGTLIYLSSLLVYGVGATAVLDPMVTLWVNISMVSLYLAMTSATVRGRLALYAILGGAAGLAFLTKGFIALALPVIVALPFALYTHQLRQLFLFGPLAILVAILISAPWVWMIHQQEPDFWNYFFWVEHIQRFAQDNAQHKAPFWYYIPVVLLGLIPWLGTLPAALSELWKKRKDSVRIVFLILWFLLPLLFFSAAKGKLVTYILTSFTPLALLMASGAIDAIDAGRIRALRWNGWMNLLLGIGGALFLIIDRNGTQPLLFREDDGQTFFLALGVCALWILISLISLKRWQMAALAPLIVGLSLATLIPQHIINGKFPETFIEDNKAALEKSAFIVADNVGLATALSWILKRTDILILDARGELTYGMAYADAGTRALSKDDLPLWLAEAKRQGDVALVLRNDTTGLPQADSVEKKRRFTLFLYRRETE